MYYLAYGSNLNVEQMAYRCPNATAEGVAMLYDYRLVYKGSKTGSYLTIEPSKGDAVPLGVWHTNRIDELALDTYEGYPSFYSKRRLYINVRFFDGTTEKVPAYVYIMNDDRPYGIPREGYIHTCLQGYRDFGFKRFYLDKALIDTYKKLK